MSMSGIPYHETGYFSSLMTDYLTQDPKLSSAYARFPSSENLAAQAAEKAKVFPSANREKLINVLNAQYEGLPLASKLGQNLKALESKNTVTVTTGHQLCLLTGPLFFIYKIISIIKLAEQLQTQTSEINVVPVYWMASEDHDFEEISSFQFHQQKIEWVKAAQGPVGRLGLNDLQPVLEAFKTTLGKSLYAEELIQILDKSYGSANTLAEATRLLVNTLFGNYGLVILDADHPELKGLFTPYMRNEIMHQKVHQQVHTQVEKIKKEYNSNYKPQVAPRTLNLFYMAKAQRHRITQEGGNYKLIGSSKVFSETELLALLEAQPEAFSPNVMMRPLYQEVILPNIAYVGGGGELAYWLQLKSYFEAEKILFPILLLRNSALVITPKDQKKCDALAVNVKDLFLKRPVLVEKKTKALTSLPIDLQFLKTTLEEQFKALEALALKTDASFKGSVAAQKAKQFKGIDRLEKRLIKAEKRKYKDIIERLILLQEHLFPKGQLQERVLNFSSFYVDHGPEFIAQLHREFDPLGFNFTIVKIGE